MKKTYIYPAVRITEADVEAVLASTSGDNTIPVSSTDSYGSNGYNNLSSKESSFDFDDEE